MTEEYMNGLFKEFEKIKDRTQNPTIYKNN